MIFMANIHQVLYHGVFDKTHFQLEYNASWAGLSGYGFKKFFQLQAHLEVNNRLLLKILAL